MLGVYLENVRSKKPLIHNITNYVTVNDVANILLACGASPIMSDDAGIKIRYLLCFWRASGRRRLAVKPYWIP